jgi:hypothetical protein
MPAEYSSSEGPRPWQHLGSSSQDMHGISAGTPNVIPKPEPVYSSGAHRVVHPLSGPGGLGVYGSSAHTPVDGVVGYGETDI